MKSNYNDYMSIYTDGSKQEDKVAWAINRYETLSARLPDTCSIFTAEAIAINLALMSIRDINYKKLIIFSDFLSVLNSLTHNDHSNSMIQQILKRYFELSKTKTIIFCWIPSHINLQGNDEADYEAKRALNQPVTNIEIPYARYKHHKRKYEQNQCKTILDNNQYNKLHKIKPIFFKLLNFYQTERNKWFWPVVLLDIHISLIILS